MRARHLPSVQAAAILVLLGGCAAAVAQTAPAPGEQRQAAAPAVPSPAAPLKLGVYDPTGAFKAANLQIEHVFMPWQGVDLGSLATAAEYARTRGRELLVTVEPWSWSPAEPLSADSLRDGILAGRYDKQIAAVCDALGSPKGRVTVRWGHEMDLKNNRYPWANWNPNDYVAAYRHFVDACRSRAPRLSFMWSPRGEYDLLDYYPGDAWVDAVGLSVFGLQAYDKAAFGGERDFAALLAPSYDLVAGLKKPIVISEFGCSGDVAYVRRCNDLSRETLRRFPLLAGVVYFNATEPGEWPAVYGKPDWRMSPEAVARFRAQ